MSVRDKVIPAIKQRMTDHGIDLPYPIQQVFIYDQTEETGDGTRQSDGWSVAESSTRRQGNVVGVVR